jgi:DNA repair photolyase
MSNNVEGLESNDQFISGYFSYLPYLLDRHLCFKICCFKDPLLPPQLVEALRRKLLPASLTYKQPIVIGTKKNPSLPKLKILKYGPIHHLRNE